MAEHEPELSFSSSMNEWSYTSTPIICPPVMHKESFAFFGVPEITLPIACSTVSFCLEHRGESGIGGVGNKKVTSTFAHWYQYETGWRGMYFLQTTSGVRNVASNKKVTSKRDR
jgi:hypothetical protein